MFTLWTWWMNDFERMSKLDIKFIISIDVLLEILLPLAISLSNG